jgi:hypothetical protein
MTASKNNDRKRQLLAALAKYENSEEARKNEQERQSFFFHVGFAIHQWAMMDRDVFTLFSVALGAKENRKAAIIYYRLSQISDHLNLTDELMRASLSGDHAKKWKEIVKRCNALLQFRNRLAHDPAHAVVTLQGTTSAEEVPGPPPTHQYLLGMERAKLLRKIGKDAPPHITIQQIKEHSREVGRLKIEMALFLSRLPKGMLRRAGILSTPRKSKPHPETAKAKSPRRKSAARKPPPRS